MNINSPKAHFTGAFGTALSSLSARPGTAESCETQKATAACGAARTNGFLQNWLLREAGGGLDVLQPEWRVRVALDMFHTMGCRDR